MEEVDEVERMDKQVSIYLSKLIVAVDNQGQGTLNSRV
jgi:hypothetical protein